MTNLFQLQDFLFEKKPGRAELMAYTPKAAASFRIAIYRNHSFELIERTIRPYLDFAGLGAEFTYSDYDDSLSFLGLDTSADLLILWLDMGRYKIDDPQAFVNERLKALRDVFPKKILFVPFGADIKSDKETTYSLAPLQQRLGDAYVDLRMEPFAGTKLSVQSCMEIAKDLGLNYIPALLRPGLKGIVVDLDNTLYKGVLGEDGIQGVHLTEAHRELQKQLKDYAARGFFLCVASKNDQRDVLRLFEERPDFPLRASDFTKIVASWDSKASSIAEIARFLNIHPNSLLFVDDNLGEIVSVMGTHPQINLIWAKEDAFITLNVLKNYPGILKLEIKKEDALRKQDTLANEARLQMMSTLSKEDYIRDLKVELEFRLNEHADINRIAELANKTNQFIFAYKRYSAKDVEQLMTGPDSAVVTISMKDKLSDSGIIGVVALKRLESGGWLDECFVSCRALGRGFDETIVLGAIQTALDHVGAELLQVDFKKGDRNLPAEKFLNDSLKAHVAAPMAFRFEPDRSLISITTRKGS